MLDTNTWFYGKLTGNAPLVVLVGTNIFDVRPEIITTFPSVIYSESNQYDMLFNDDQPSVSDSTMIVDVYVKNDSPSAIASAVCDIFKPLLWACTANREIPDSAPGVKHRHLEFTRSVGLGDLS